MSLDAYQPCPCGIDKKIKFCCGTEILDDLAKIDDALAGEQRLGALDLCNRLLAQKPDRPCLLMHKATVQMALSELPACRETVTQLLKVAPGNPGGLAISAMLDCQEGNGLAAVGALQSALETQQGKLIPVVYEAIGIVARTLDAIGEPLAAQTYAVFQAAASGGKDRNAVMTLLELEASGQIPLAIHGMTGLVPAPAEGVLKAAEIAEFSAALHQADIGCWGRAAEMFEKLAQKAAGEPAVWRNIAVCKLRVLENAGAIAALRRFAAMPTVPRDDAVEAEALAQFLSDPTEIDFVPEVTVTYAVTDVQALREQLLSSKRVHSVPFDPAQFREGDEPPPLAMFLLLDREVPPNSQNLSRDNIPKVLGETLLYGKETGTVNAFTVSGALAGGADPFVGGAEIVQAATDAKFAVDGLTVTRSSNTISDVISGVTFVLRNEGDQNGTIGASDPSSKITIGSDPSALQSSVKSLVDSYNAVNQLINNQFKVDSNTNQQGAVGGDASLKGVISRLRQELGASGGNGSGYKYLSDIGVSFQKDGSLALDNAKLAGALEKDTTSVANLFVGLQNGIGKRIPNAIDEYINAATGTLTLRQKGNAQSIKQIDDKVTRENTRIAAYQERLTQQFSALEKIVGQLKSQGDYLTQQFAALAKA
jgi:hypothetical protein